MTFLHFLNSIKLSFLTLPSVIVPLKLNFMFPSSFEIFWENPLAKSCYIFCLLFHIFTLVQSLSAKILEEINSKISRRFDVLYPDHSAPISIFFDRWIYKIEPYGRSNFAEILWSGREVLCNTNLLWEKIWKIYFTRIARR